MDKDDSLPVAPEQAAGAAEFFEISRAAPGEHEDGILRFGIGGLQDGSAWQPRMIVSRKPLPPHGEQAEQFVDGRHRGCRRGAVVEQGVRPRVLELEPFRFVEETQAVAVAVAVFRRRGGEAASPHAVPQAVVVGRVEPGIETLLLT